MDVCPLKRIIICYEPFYLFVELINLQVSEFVESGLAKLARTFVFIESFFRLLFC